MTKSEYPGVFARLAFASGNAGRAEMARKVAREMPLKILWRAFCEARTTEEAAILWAGIQRLLDEHAAPRYGREVLLLC